MVRQTYIFLYVLIKLNVYFCFSDNLLLEMKCLLQLTYMLDCQNPVSAMQNPELLTCLFEFYTGTQYCPDSSLLALPFSWKEMTSLIYYN